MVEMVWHCEGMGFNHVALSEHYLLPDQLQGIRNDVFYDSFASSTAAFVQTSRIRILNGNIIVPLHPRS